MISFTSYVMLAFVIGIVATAIIIPIIIAFCRTYGYFDHPNQRKLHHAAIPRLGGLAFLPSMAIGGSITLLVYYSQTLTTPVYHITAALMIIGAFIIYLVGVLDDLLDLSAHLKFIILATGSAILPTCNLLINNLYGLFGIEELPLWVAYPLTVLVIMTIVNAINLIDGIDGLASGFTAICLVVFIYLFQDLQSIIFTVLSAALLGSVFMFLFFNIFGRIGKLKIFMGDAGSLILGYVLSYFAVKYMMMTEQDIYTDINPILIPYSLFIVPVFDLIRVALVRILSGEPMFQADQRHIHHVLMSSGLSMHQTLGVILSLVVGFILLNMLLDFWGVPFTVIFLMDLTLFALFFVVVYCLAPSNEKDTSLA